MTNIYINPETVKESGRSQQDVATNFIQAVQGIFDSIETICSNGWKGTSATTYTQVTGAYYNDMMELGRLVDSHGSSDIRSANNMEDADTDAANVARNM